MDCLIFDPIYQERVWGGRLLETRFGRNLPDPVQPFGESWEISGRPEAESRVACGPYQGRTINELWQGDRREAIFGSAAPFGESENFPLLCKILDAQEKLSIQVHPPAGVAEKLGGEPKTEMWYIAAAVPGAELYVGLESVITSDDFAQALIEKRVEEIVHRIPVRQGEFIFIPSGRLHAIGAGILIYEIQQNSDTTYRVFDWNRMGLDGKPRQLHIEESLQCINFSDVRPEMDTASGTLLAECEHFRVERHPVMGRGIDLFLPPKFAIVTVTSGEVRLGDDSFRAGDFFILPAESSGARSLEAEKEAEVLLTLWPE